MTFSLGGTDASFFTIDENTGAVTLTGNPDFESKSSYSFSVTATDDAGNVSSAQPVTLAINDLDEVAPAGPTITQVSDNVDPAQGNVTNGGKTNDTQPTVRVTFSTLGATGAVAGDRVQLYNGASALGAAILLSATDITNGFIDITPSALGDGDYDLSATLIDQADNESAHSASFGFEVDTVIGAVPTDIVLTPSTIAENSAVNSVVGTLSAIDTDTGDTFTFTLQDDDNGHFALVGNQIVVNGPLDFEEAATRTIHVKVTDSDANVFDTDVVIAIGDVDGVTIKGSTGNDKINATHHVKGQTLLPTGEEDVISGRAGNDKISSLGGNDTVSGGAGNDNLSGGDGIDTLKGGAGNDKITGGNGLDTMFGNAGADKFVFLQTDVVLGNGDTTTDIIADFKHSQLDKIDLHLIDANTGIGNDQKFDFIGNNHAFTGQAGELRYDAALHLLQGDVNGDGTADFSINLVNVTHLVKGDFIL